MDVKAQKLGNGLSGHLSRTAELTRSWLSDIVLFCLVGSEQFYTCQLVVLNVLKTTWGEEMGFLVSEPG